MQPAPEGYDWLCASCSKPRTTHHCESCEEPVQVYAWPQGEYPVWDARSNYEGLPVEVEALQREVNQTIELEVAQ